MVALIPRETLSNRRRPARPAALCVGLLAALALLATSGCNFTRSAQDMKSIPATGANFTIEAPCAAEDAQRAVKGAAAALELDEEAPSSGPGEPWVFRRGPRLADPVLLYRVDVVPVADRKDASTIRVFALTASRILTDTQETMSKPGALAMRIVAACAVKGAP
ncbi:MAG: hypothetical protein U0359_25630 [Byssovorax sp.]